MSTTFYIPGAPKVRQECRWCLQAQGGHQSGHVALKGEWVEWTSVSEEDKALVRCDPYCRGYDEESTLPEANFAEANAMNLLHLLGLEPDYGGTIPNADIPALMRRILVLCASPKERAHLIREESVETSRTVNLDDADLPRIGPGARIIDFGNTDEQTLGRLIRLRSVLSAAAQNGYDVCWG